MDFSSKLASNSKLTSNKHKKHLENNLCLYCGAENHKLDSCSKKQTTVSSKSCSIVVTTRQNSTCSLLTSAKLSVGYLVVRITRELDKELSLYCYPIYINYM